MQIPSSANSLKSSPRRPTTHEQARAPSRTDHNAALRSIHTLHRGKCSSSLQNSEARYTYRPKYVERGLDLNQAVSGQWREQEQTFIVHAAQSKRTRFSGLVAGHVLVQFLRLRYRASLGLMLKNRKSATAEKSVRRDAKETAAVSEQYIGMQPAGQSRANLRRTINYVDELAHLQFELIKLRGMGPAAGPPRWPSFSKGVTPRERGGVIKRITQSLEPSRLSRRCARHADDS